MKRNHSVRSDDILVGTKKNQLQPGFFLIVVGGFFQIVHEFHIIKNLSLFLGEIRDDLCRIRLLKAGNPDLLNDRVFVDGDDYFNSP